MLAGWGVPVSAGWHRQSFGVDVATESDFLERLSVCAAQEVLALLAKRECLLCCAHRHLSEIGRYGCTRRFVDRCRCHPRSAGTRETRSGLRL